MPVSRNSLPTTSAALQTRKENRLFGAGIEIADKLRTPLGGAHGCREAGACQLPEARVGFPRRTQI